jgi:hypothetical protein
MSARAARRVTPASAIVLAFLGTLLSVAPAFGQQSKMDPAKRALIQELLTLTRAPELMVSSMEAGLPAQRAAMPQVPKEFWDEFMVRARQDLPRFIEMVMPIWDANFSKAQLEELVAFYKSPLGRHLASVQPVVTQQSMQVGQRWGEQLGTEVAETLRKRGVRMPQ